MAELWNIRSLFRSPQRVISRLREKKRERFSSLRREEAREMLKDREGLQNSPGAPDECAGCGGRIQDRFYLLAVDRQWHGACLRCCECRQPLDTELSCFHRDGNIYCKGDYYRLFCVKRCARCGNGITANEMVMRARDMVYHLTCFACVACGTLLSKGDMFGMREAMVYCRSHYNAACFDDHCEDDGSVYRCHDLSGDGSPGAYCSPGPALKGKPRKRRLQGSDELQVQTMRLASNALEILHRGELSSSMESLAYESAASPGSASGHQSRAKRMRTSFKHHQLRTMKSYFAVNQNPDAKDLKQLAQKTGLSKRVLQVWFQNARAKWRRNMMRQDGGGAGPSAAGALLGNGALLGPAGGSTHASLLMPEQLQGVDEMRVHTPHPSQGLTFSELY